MYQDFTLLGFVIETSPPSNKMVGRLPSLRGEGTVSLPLLGEGEDGVCFKFYIFN